MTNHTTAVSKLKYYLPVCGMIVYNNIQNGKFRTYNIYLNPFCFVQIYILGMTAKFVKDYIVYID